ncbi:autotransporter strand-loop-strand O-heptosyltransferase [Acetobacteraceae bacterium]|nr:autotransporter strand-loop-strand O-heptosyltransferase [Acetobacteraceae bacterium]
MEGPKGIRFDFNDGCRVDVPSGKKWRVQFRDTGTDTVLFDQWLDQGGRVQSAKHYYLPFQITVWEESEAEPVFQHKCDLYGKKVVVHMELGGLGDHLAWVGQAMAFGRQHKAELVCVVRADLAEILAPANPDITFVTADKVPTDSYASYKVLVFFDDVSRNWQPLDYRQAGLGRMGAYMLGLTPENRRPDIDIEDKPPIEDPYVVIAVQGSGLGKMWNNPYGWRQVVQFLKSLGYRVICIDQARVTGVNTVWTHIPHGVEDETGNRPLKERARWLKHADFFIGLSSGLSWLAWAAQTKVVMVGGFTEDYNEFETPWRIINRNVCHGCANDLAIRLDLKDYFFCPRHKNTDRAFECSRLISGNQVIQACSDLILDLPQEKRDRLKLFSEMPERPKKVVKAHKAKEKGASTKKVPKKSGEKKSVAKPTAKASKKGTPKSSKKKGQPQ